MEEWNLGIKNLSKTHLPSDNASGDRSVVWIRETETGQQVAQLQDRYMMMMMMIKHVRPIYSFAGNSTQVTNLNIMKMMFNGLMRIFFTPLWTVGGFYISPQTWPWFALELSLLGQYFQKKRNSNLYLHFPKFLFVCFYLR